MKTDKPDYKVRFSGPIREKLQSEAEFHLLTVADVIKMAVAQYFRGKDAQEAGK